MTRPLGASLGDFLSQSQKHGGLGWGATITSVVFLTAILAVVTYLSITKRDVIKKAVTEEKVSSRQNVFMQTALTMVLLVLVAGTGYYYRQASLQGVVANVDSENIEVEKSIENPDQITEKDETKVVDSQVVQEDTSTEATTPVVKPTEVPKPIVKTYPLGDVSSFKTITQDTLNLVLASKPADAKERIGDLEYEWDNAEAKLKRMDGAKWTEVDDAIDAALRQVRAVKPDAKKSEASLKALLVTLN
jgi:Ca2+/Na+ antiporter